MSVGRQSHDLIRFVVKGFDIKTGGNVKVVPTSASARLFVPVHLHIIIATKTGTQSATMLANTFGNDSAKSNIASSVSITSTSAVGQLYSWDATTTAGGYDCSSGNGAGGGIYFKATGGGGTLTSMTVDIHVCGYYAS